MSDTLRIKRTYIPKKYWSQIDSIIVEADYDYQRNRSYQHYFVTFTDGHKLDASTVVTLVKEIKSYLKKG